MNLKQKLARKLKKTGGFTLIEMLIVVAIIAILIAVSIPVVGGALEKAREATDAANERAAKAAAVIAYLTDDTFVTGSDYYYDAAAGELKPGTTPADGKSYGQCSEHEGKVIVVQVDADGNVKLGWGAADNTDLDSPGLMTTTTTPAAGGGGAGT